MAGEGLTTRPSRVTIASVDTGKSVDAQFNPQEISEKLGVNWKELDILGMSHKPLQYLNTENLTLSFDLVFNVLSQNGDQAFSTRLFLHSLCYSKRGSQDVIGGGPSRVLFSWPNLFSLTCVMATMEIKHQRFNNAMQSMQFTATLTIKEARINRLYAEDVLSQGTLRSA